MPHLLVREKRAEVLCVQLLRTNHNFVGHCVKHIEQLFLLLLGVKFGQEHLCQVLLLNVEDQLKHQEGADPQKEASPKVEFPILLFALVHKETLHANINHGSCNEVQEEV